LKNNLIFGSLAAPASTKNPPDCNYKDQTNALTVLLFGLIFLVRVPLWVPMKGAQA